MKTLNWTDIAAIITNLAPPFIASITGALITLLVRVRARKNELRDIFLEAAFCIPFGTLLGYIVAIITGHNDWSIAAASAGGMFGEKIYARLSKRVETIEIDDFADPLSILDNSNEHKNKDLTMKHTQKGYFLGIGLNKLNGECYNGWEGELQGARNDIKKLASLAHQKGFDINRLMDSGANLFNVRSQLDEFKTTAKKGDTVWIAFSGHGGQTKNASGNTLETYCLYDGQMADFEMLNHIASMPEGVKVILTLDCCHAGGFDKKLGFIEGGARSKAMPKDIQIALPKEYTTAIQDAVKFYGEEMKGGQELIILAACQKNEVALDGKNNGLFTAAMLKTHLSDEDLSYSDFMERVSEICEPSQKPRLIKRPKGSQLKGNQHFTI